MHHAPSALGAVCGTPGRLVLVDPFNWTGVKACEICPVPALIFFLTLSF